MLKLSGVLKHESFNFEDVNGVVHNLKMSEYTIGDVKKLIEIQQPIHEKNDMSIAEQSEMIIASRIICGVKKRDTGEYFWEKITDFTQAGYPNDLQNVLYPMVNKLNPIHLETVDEKKN